MNLSVEHVLMIVLVAFALHYLMGNCGCRRVEGISNRTEGECCNMNECGDGLECNITSMTTKCLENPGHYWYGTCQKKTDWFAGVAHRVAHGVSPMNKEEGKCCHWGDCKVGLQCDSSGLSLFGGKCGGGWSGICKPANPLSLL